MFTSLICKKIQKPKRIPITWSKTIVGKVEIILFVGFQVIQLEMNWYITAFEIVASN